LKCTVLEGIDGFWQVDAPRFGSAIAALRLLCAGLPSVVYSSNAPDLRWWIGSLARIASDLDAKHASETVGQLLP
jgi:hypothetical protein